MNKITLLLAGLLCTIASIAQPTVNVQPAAVSAAVGDQITVALVVDDFPAIVSYQHSVNWDETLLSYVGFGAVNTGLQGLANGIIDNQQSEGILKVLWTDPSPTLAGVTLPPGDTLFTITFDVIAAGTTTVALTDNPLDIEITQSNTGNLGLNTTPSTVTLTGGNGGGGGNTSDVTFTVGDLTGDPGQTVCAPVTVTNFTNIGGIGFTLTHDPTLLTFANVANVNLAGASAANFNAPASQPGNVIFTWNNNSAQTLADGTAIFELCYTLDNVGTGTVDITDNLTNIEVIDGNNQLLSPVITNSGTVTVNGTTNSTDFSISVGSGSGDSGDQVCVPLVTQNLTDLTGLGFTVSFDPAVVQFDSVANINLGSTNNFNAPASQPGNIIFTYDNSVPQSLANGTAIADLCFTLIGAGGTQSAVSITGNLTPIEAIDANTQPVPVTVNPGQLTINSGTGTTTDFTLTLGSVNVAPGANVCVPVTVDNFDNIVSAQFTIEFDETLVAFTGATNLQLPDLTVNNFNAPAALPGKIIFSWNTSAPTSVADGSTIFELCFDALGQLGDSSPLNITGNPTSIEIFEDGGTLVDPVVTQPGQITIADVTAAPDPVELSIGNASADSGANACVPVTVANFENITATSFSINYNSNDLTYTGAQGLNLAGLSAGDITETTPGTITVSYSNASTTVADGTTIFSLCFDATGAAGTTVPLTVVTGATASNVDGSVGVNTSNGQFTINSNNPLPTGDVLFVFPPQSAESGAQVCVPLTVYDFNNILSFQYSICYDPSQLDFTGIQNINLNDLDNSSITENTDGQIGVVWVSVTDLLNGTTVPDQTAIVELCFDVLAPNGTTALVEFCETPTPTEVSEANGNDSPIPLTPGFQAAVITIEAATSCPALTLSGTTTDVACNGDATGSITLDVSGGDSNYQYSWSNGATTPNLDNLTAGTYNVTVTSCSGAASQTQSFTVEEPGAALAISNAQITNVQCAGDTNGAIDLTITGGSPGYTFNWSNNAPVDDSEDQSNLAAGTYSVTITDANGCTLASPSYTVSAPAAINVTDVITTNPTGCGTNDGTLAVTANGGTPPLQYSIDGGANFQNANTFNNLSAGTITARVRDANGCVVTANPVTLTGSDTPPTIIVANLTPADPNVANGAITLQITNGSGNYTYAWTPGNFTSNSISNLSGGEYTVTVTDNATQCAADLTILVPTTIQVSGTTTATCAGAAAGTIDLSVLGGNSNGSFTYNYTPSNVGTLAANGDLTNLPPGTYTVTVSDGSGLVPDGTATFTITELDAPSIDNVDITNVTGLPTNTNGCVEVTATGTAPLTYAWSNGANTAENCNLPTGNYTVTITDGNGCTTTGGPYEVSFENAPLDAGTATTTVVPCTPDVEICFPIDGGVAPYTVTTVATDGTTTTETAAAAGTYCITVAAGTDYTITVSDAAGGSDEFDVEVDANPAPTTFTTAVTPATSGSNNGAIDLTVTSNDGPFTYQWSNGATTEDINGLAAGCYQVTITNGVGCTVPSGDVCVVTLTVSGAQVTDLDCPNDLDGGVDITVVGVTNPTFVWTDAAGAQVSTNEDLTGVPAGTYSVIITDASGQQAGPFTYTVGVLSNLSGSVTVASDYNGAAISCADATDGSLTATGTNGVAPYNFSWSTGANTATVSNLAAGEYFVTITDGNGCTVIGSQVLEAPIAVTLTGSSTPTACLDETDGTATVMASGGTGAYTYLYDANAGDQTTNTATELSAGTYGVTVTDANGCAANTEITVDEPTAIAIQVDTEPDSGEGVGRATALVSGGTAPYTYDWGPTVESDDVSVGGLATGEYTLTVTDDNGCTTTQDFRIDEAGNCLVSRPVITPNGDGSNENFIIGCVQQYEQATLQVFNRWGQEVFTMSNYDNSWAGQTNRGRELPEGVYFFVLDYRDTGGTSQQLKGSVSLLRD